MVLLISSKEIYKYWVYPSVSILYFSSDADEYYKTAEKYFKNLCNRFKNILCLKVIYSEFLLQNFKNQNKGSPLDVLLIGCEKILTFLSKPTYGDLEQLFFYVHKTHQLSLEEILSLKSDPTCVKYEFLQNFCQRHLSEMKTVKFGNIDINSLFNQVNENENTSHSEPSSSYAYSSFKQDQDKSAQTQFKDPNKFTIFFKKCGKMQKIKPYFKKNKVSNLRNVPKNNKNFRIMPNLRSCRNRRIFTSFFNRKSINASSSISQKLLSVNKK